MEARRAPSRMTIPLRGFSALSDNTHYAQDRGPCQTCYECRPDAKEMAATPNHGVCVMCNAKTGARRCARCESTQYCSVECQRADWPMHKLVCKQFQTASDASRPSESHFRVLFFPHEASQPEFCWASTNGSDELVVQHATINSWRASMKGRYSKAEASDPLVNHALTRDGAMRGKVFGHALRVAYWQPPEGVTGHLEGFNETVLSLMTETLAKLGHHQYGPLVAFAYKLDSEFDYQAMDDMTTADFRHLVDWFHNSAWNPTVYDLDRYRGKTVPGLLIPDSTHLSSESCSEPHNIINNVIGMRVPLLSVTIPDKLNVDQRCSSPLCPPRRLPAIMEMCLRGDIWHAFPLGPLLLGLPWINRNAIITDIHNTGSRRRWPAQRWNNTMARYLRQGVHIHGGKMTIEPLNMSDGLIVFHERGLKIDPLHLQAYNDFINRPQPASARERSYTKESFSKFWKALQSGKVKSQGVDKATFKEAASPYDGFDDEQPASVLVPEMARQYGILMRLFRGQEIREEIKSMLDERCFVADPGLGFFRVPEEFAFWLRDPFNDEFNKETADDTAPSAQDLQTPATDGEGDRLASLAAASLNFMDKQL
ncbi:hypothetical protein ACHAPT_012826 [Fusarium lateritium]